MHNNISDTLLGEYINYYKKKYVEKYGTKYNSNLSILYKANKIYEEYKIFIDSINIQSNIDKSIIDSYLDNNKDIDYMFFDLLNNNKLRKNRINSNYYEQLSEEELLRYSIIINFINNRLETIGSNEVFKDRIVLSDVKNKKLYYDYMNKYFYSKRYKPASKYVKYSKISLSEEEKRLVENYEEIYSNYYNDNLNTDVRTCYLNPREAIEREKVSMDELLDIVDKLMAVDRKYTILEFYKLSPYSVNTFYNMVKSSLTVNKKVFINIFYNTYKDDISISEQRINDIIEKELIKYGFDDGSFYQVTKEDKQQVMLLLEEENIPITNRTFSVRLRKYFIENIKEQYNNKVLTKK